MAEINIQPKKPSPWSYLLYGVALLAVVFLVYVSLTRPKNPVQTQAVVVDSGKVSGSVNAFIGYIHTGSPDETGSTGDVQSSPQYASYGLHLLAAAIGATVDRDEPNNQTLKQKRIQLQQTADSINSNWDAAAKSGPIKTAFLSAVDLLNELQSRHYPDMKDNIEQAQKVAEAINPDQQAVQQSDLVKEFFEQSGQILQAMVPRKQSAGV